MVSGFDIWGHDANLRKHWKNRALAFIVDAIISFVPVSIVLYLLNITDILEVGIIVSTVFYLASSIPESITGSSVGKSMFHLQVHAINVGAVTGRVYVRNLSRLFWFVMPPLDFTLGMATRGDPRQKMLDRVAGTKVVHRAEKKKYQRHMKKLAKSEEVGEEKSDSSSEKPISEDLCHECDGKLILLVDEKLQCEKCGLIQ